jgi:hypothetical protein
LTGPSICNGMEGKVNQIGSAGMRSNTSRGAAGCAIHVKARRELGRCADEFWPQTTTADGCDGSSFKDNG